MDFPTSDKRSSVAEKRADGLGHVFGVFEAAPVPDSTEQHTNSALVWRQHYDWNQWQHRTEPYGRRSHRTAELHHAADAVGVGCSSTKADVAAERRGHHVRGLQPEGVE